MRNSSTHTTTQQVHDLFEKAIQAYSDMRQAEVRHLLAA